MRHHSSWRDPTANKTDIRLALKEFVFKWTKKSASVSPTEVMLQRNYSAADVTEKRWERQVLP